MLTLSEYEQTAVWNPTDPTQVIREVYTPGGFSSFYFNRLKPSAVLSGSRGLGEGWSTLPSWLQIGIVGLSAAGIGFLGMKQFGASHIKPAMKKLGLGGARRGRRR